MKMKMNLKLHWYLSTMKKLNKSICYVNRYIIRKLLNTVYYTYTLNLKERNNNHDYSSEIFANFR
jgi:hypothetical protein